MHIQTHIMSGWCIANCLQLTARERLFAMLAASLPDLDGVTYVFGREAYWATHHVYGHNLLFALALSGILTFFSTHKLKCFLIFLGLVHLHFFMDLLGSGESWTIPYFLPFGSHGYEWSSGWEFNGIENKIAGLFLLIWCLRIAVFQKRTPLECFLPKLDAQLVDLAQKLRFGKFGLAIRYWYLPLIAFYGMEVVHEFGHVLAGILTGGTIETVELWPWRFSRTGLTDNPHPGVVAWSGLLVGMLLPLVVWLIFRRWKYAHFLRFFAGFCLVANGLYIGVDGFEKTGDCFEMFKIGTPRWSMILFGISAVIPGLFLWNGLAKIFSERGKIHEKDIG